MFSQCKMPVFKATPYNHISHVFTQIHCDKLKIIIYIVELSVRTDFTENYMRYIREK